MSQDAVMMSPDAILLAKAIVSLQPTPDFWKDYIFPIVLAFFSALLGGASAIYINRKQELKNITKDNFVAASQIYVMAYECLSNLVAIKGNYVHIKSDEPLVRAGMFPTIATKLEDVSFNARSLYFIRPIPTANKTLRQKTIWYFKHKILKIKIEEPLSEELRKSWRNPVRTSAMFSNYNQAMELFRVRNSINEKVKDILSQHHNLLGDIPREDVRNLLGINLFVPFIDTTESSIAVTDYVMTELYDFLLKFPDIAESNIELGRIKEWGRFATYKNTQGSFQNCMKPMLKPDYKILSEYTGASVEYLEKKYDFSSLA